MTQLLESDPFSVRDDAQPRLLVLGLGNSILRDDGVGIHAVRHFQLFAPWSCLAVEVGTAVLSALHLLGAADKVIAFDAMQAGGKPGTVYILPAEDVLNEGIQNSLHEMDLQWALHTLKEPRPEVLVIAAEPEAIEYGMELSPSLQAAIPIMIDAALAILEKWQNCGALGSRLSQADLSGVLVPLGRQQILALQSEDAATGV